MESRRLNYKRMGDVFGGAGYVHFLDCSDDFKCGIVKHIQVYTLDMVLYIHETFISLFKKRVCEL